MRLFRKLLLQHVIVILCVVLILSVVLSIVIENALYKQKIQDLKQLGTSLLRPGNQSLWEDSRSFKKLARLFRQNQIYLVRLGLDGRALDQEAVSIPDSIWREVKKNTIAEGKEKFGKRSVTWVVILHDKGALLLYSPIEGLAKTILQVRIAILLTALVVFVCSIAISGWFSRKLVRRIEAIRFVSQKIGEGEYQHRVPVPGDQADEITDLVQDMNQMAEQLEISQRELKRFEKNRQQFLLDLSHELRTPLTSIRGWLEALQKGYVATEEKEQVYSRMEKEIQRLIRLIQELMDLEKIRAGKIELQRDWYAVRDVFEFVCDQFQWLAEEKGLTLRMEIMGDPEPYVYVDYDRMQQIIGNLVKNAIQFTEKGEIVLGAKGDLTQTVIWVKDTGIGIPQEDLQKIWERFFKVDPSRARRGNETGLGLAIVKQLVEAHQGKIEVESEPGKGTTFTILLPLPHNNRNFVPDLS